MKKYFSQGLIATFIIATIFSIGAFVPTAKVQAQTNFNICQMVDLFINIGVISPDKASAARLAAGCSVPPVVSTNQPWVISNVIGAKDQYLPEETISFSTYGMKTDGSVTGLTPAEGFHVQAHIRTDEAYPQGLVGVNSQYNYIAGAWDVIMTAPLAPGKYVMDAQLYCSNHNLSCYTQYGDDHQADWQKHFIVSDGTIPPVSQTHVSLLSDTAIGLEYVGGQEVALSAKVKYSITAGTDIGFYEDGLKQLKFINSSTLKQVYLNNINSTVTVISGATKTYDIYDRPYWKINEGDTAVFTTTVSVNPKQMFQGYYYATLKEIISCPFTDGNQNGSCINITVPDNKSNKQVITGEISPYISSVIPLASTDGARGLVVSGARLAKGTSVNVQCNGSNYPVGLMATMPNNNEKVYVDISTLPAGASCLITITNSFGASNIVGFQVSGDVVKPVLISETIKCVFNGSTQPQYCSTTNKDGKVYSFASIGSAGGSVSGYEDEKLTWKSSCGGYAYTVMDGKTETISFSCGSVLPLTTSTTTPISINGSCGTKVNTCNAGILADTADSPTQYQWNCLGKNGGTSAVCSISIPVASVFPDTSNMKMFSGDYNGDGNIDVAYWNPADGKWYIKSQLEGSPELIILNGFQYGGSTMTVVSGDYDGNGSSDLALWNPSDGMWYIYSVSGKKNIVWAKQYGAPSMTPKSWDYDGDGVYDLALKDKDGKWYIFSLAKNANLVWGTPIASADDVSNYATASVGWETFLKLFQALR
jgi:hypothetical protein